jgi:hypothetical protein
MNDAVRQATSTELTIGGISGSQSRVTWSYFYTIITICAKFLDLSHTENSALSVVVISPSNTDVVEIYQSLLCIRKTPVPI